MMGSASYSDFQVPNTPGVASGTAPGGNTWASAMPADVPGFAALSIRPTTTKIKTSRIITGSLTYQKSAGDLDFQVSAFGRESEQHFTPDPMGDLFLNGEASEVDRALYSAGLQADGSYHLGRTIRSGPAGRFWRTGDQNNTTTDGLQPERAPGTRRP